MRPLFPPPQQDKLAQTSVNSAHVSHEYQQQQVHFDPASSLPIQTLHLGTRLPATVVCPFCHAEMRTQTKYHANVVTWIIFALFGFFCWGLCLSFAPFCCKLCLETEQYCTHCHCKVAAEGPFAA